LTLFFFSLSASDSTRIPFFPPILNGWFFFPPDYGSWWQQIFLSPLTVDSRLVPFPLDLVFPCCQYARQAPLSSPPHKERVDLLSFPPRFGKIVSAIRVLHSCVRNAYTFANATLSPPFSKYSPSRLFFVLRRDRLGSSRFQQRGLPFFFRPRSGQHGVSLSLFLFRTLHFLLRQPFHPVPFPWIGNLYLLFFPLSFFREIILFPPLLSLFLGSAPTGILPPFLYPLFLSMVDCPFPLPSFFGRAVYLLPP